MPERILPGLGLRAFYDPGQRSWGTSVSEDLRALSALVQARALSRSTALPGSGNAGDISLVPDDAAEHAECSLVSCQAMRRSSENAAGPNFAGRFSVRRCAGG